MFVIGVAGFTCLVIQPAKDAKRGIRQADERGWKKVSTGRFMLMLPNDWIITTEDNNLLKATNTKGYIEISATQSSNFVIPKKGNNKFYDYVGETTIGIYDATKTDWQAKGKFSGRFISYFIPFGESVIKISIEDSDKTGDYYNFDKYDLPGAKMYQKILSTFRFLD